MKAGLLSAPRRVAGPYHTKARASSALAVARLPRRVAGRRLQARRTQPRRARGYGCSAAAFGGGGSGSGGGSSDAQASSPERLRLLLKFVHEADPGIMQQFEDEAHPCVLVAMRQTITNMLGTLPPHVFQVTITTSAENLSTLMYSTLLTGYMFNNVWTRISLNQSLADQPIALLEPEKASLYGVLVGPGGQAFDPSGSSSGASGPPSSDEEEEASEEDDDYAPGTQKVNVEGEVLRWHNERGKEAIPALAYIQQLEEENEAIHAQMEELREELAKKEQQQPLPGNELLDFIKAHAQLPEFLEQYTEEASDDVMAAMHLMVERLMGMEEEAWQGGVSDCTGEELAQLCYWLMITGYSLRTLERRCDLTRTLDLPAPEDTQPPPSLPPGRSPA